MSSNRRVRSRVLATTVISMLGVFAVSCAFPTPFEAIPRDYTGAVTPARTAVAYGPGRYRLADIYDSRGSKGTIVYLHEGGWGGGTRKAVPSVLLHQVVRGWDLVSIDYRLAGAATFPAAVHDASDAVSWVRREGARFGLDTTRIVLSGWSAGANIAALVGFGANSTAFPGGDLSAVDGLFLLAGAYDMTRVGLPYLDKPGGWLASLRNGRRDSSPVRWLDAQDPTTLAIHGVDDWVLPIEQVRLLVQRSRAVGHGHRMQAIESSDPAFEKACRQHEPWCGAPIASINGFLDGVPRGSAERADAARSADHP